MSCYGNPYNPVIFEREIPTIPYGASSYYQSQGATSGVAPTGVTPTGVTPTMALPTGVPSGPPYGGTQLTPVTPTTQTGIQVPQTVQNPYYLAGKLKEYVGRDVRVEFLIGTNGPLVDRIGTLLEVGASYITIRLIRTDDTLVCDLYSIKFVTVYG